MASSAAVLYARPTLSGSGVGGKGSGAVLFAASRMFSGLWGQNGVGASSDLSDLMAWLPSQRQPIGWVNINGQRLPVEMDAQSWYRFFVTIAEIKLGGIGGATLPDVVSTVTTTQSQAATNATQVAQVAQVTEANAQATAALKEVAKNNSLAGADQIPRVITGVYENFP